MDNGVWTTDRPTVIPHPQGARHIDAGHGATLCGIGIRGAGESLRFSAVPGKRISCLYCYEGRLRTGAPNG